MLHTHPDAGEIIEAVREFLGDVILPRLERDQVYPMRVALNLLAILGRELASDARAQSEFAAGMARFHAESEAQLSAYIRAGDLSVASPGLVEFLEMVTRARLEVSNPRYLTQFDRPAARSKGAK